MKVQLTSIASNVFHDFYDLIANVKQLSNKKIKLINCLHTVTLMKYQDYGSLAMLQLFSPQSKAGFPRGKGAALNSVNC